MKNNIIKITMARFRPLSGLWFFLFNRKGNKQSGKPCFRPLSGLWFFLYETNVERKEQNYSVFVPYRGYGSFYTWNNSKDLFKDAFAPFSSPIGVMVLFINTKSSV